MYAAGEILVTGARSGLGRHCCERFNGVPLTRQTSFAELYDAAKQKPFRAIIHAAFNTKPEVSDTQLYTYLQDTLLLTKQLLTLPHQKFIFISSVDVYPKNHQRHHEDETIQLNDVHNIYGVAKLMTESMVQHEGNNPLILRPTALLGVYAKANSLVKILTQANVALTLAAESTFNYIRHEDVSEFIQQALLMDLTGIYNLAAAEKISLAEICQRYQRSAVFGQYAYQTDDIANEKALAVRADFARTSLENVQLFIESGVCKERCSGM
ncbi:MAG TPA: NAD(P)-dependent oxidoreductase [Gammaproteobacteria bacterium]|jgi:nucleoside-diphosphate-sugar epimerase|nr:NAD(P)-dependent oxidoreductase [Gammaproteobacteria bacterium]